MLNLNIKMKKLIVIAAVAFTACKGGSSETPTSCDSTKVKIDTVKIDSVKVIDSTPVKK